MLKKAKKPKSSPLLFQIPAPEVKASELPDFFDVICPECSVHWANAHIDFGQPIRRENFSTRKDLSAQVKFQKGGLPICPACDFKYTPYAMYTLMVASLAKKRMETKLWGSQTYAKPQD